GHLIGGPDPADRNVIAGNRQYGIDLQGALDSVIRNNYIGVDATGAAAAANEFDGVQLSGINNTIADNVISGNLGDGIEFALGGANSRITGNIIGLNAAGDAVIPNQGAGVFLRVPGGEVLIGGPDAADRNVISGNAGSGIA